MPSPDGRRSPTRPASAAARNDQHDPAVRTTTASRCSRASHPASPRRLLGESTDYSTGERVHRHRHDQRGGEANERVGAQACALLPQLTLQPDREPGNPMIAPEVLDRTNLGDDQEICAHRGPLRPKRTEAPTCGIQVPSRSRRSIYAVRDEDAGSNPATPTQLKGNSHNGMWPFVCRTAAKESKHLHPRMHIEGG